MIFSDVYLKFICKWWDFNREKEFSENYLLLFVFGLQLTTERNDPSFLFLILIFLETDVLEKHTLFYEFPAAL